METDSLESIEFLCEKRECIDNLVTIRSSSSADLQWTFSEEIMVFRCTLFILFEPSLH